MFMSMIHFELIFVEAIKSLSTFLYTTTSRPLPLYLHKTPVSLNYSLLAAQHLPSFMWFRISLSTASPAFLLSDILMRDPS